MSTRCQIGFYESDNTDLLKPAALVYKHSDGYPEGVLPELVPFLKLFQQRRGTTLTVYETDFSHGATQESNFHLVQTINLTA